MSTPGIDVCPSCHSEVSPVDHTNRYGPVSTLEMSCSCGERFSIVAIDYPDCDVEFFGRTDGSKCGDNDCSGTAKYVRNRSTDPTPVFRCSEHIRFVDLLESFTDRY
jgi:hypothetical protein